MTFKRTQHLLKRGENAITRAHSIPLDVRTYANKEQLGLSGDTSPGRGRCETPTLADIYFTLIEQGIKLARPGMVFGEGEKGGNRKIRILYPTAPGGLNDKLKELKKRIDADGSGFTVIPHQRKDQRIYKNVALEDLAVPLMRLAIQNS